VLLLLVIQRGLLVKRIGLGLLVIGGQEVFEGDAIRLILDGILGHVLLLSIGHQV